MARYLTLSNGSMLVGIDGVGHVRDFYYPRVGLENHISGASGTFQHRVGVWVEGRLAWLSDPSWQVSVYAEEGVMAGTVQATNHNLGVSLSLHDVVDHERNVFVRHVTVTNMASMPRTIKLFFAQQFRISEERRGETGFYDPRVHAIIHYKGHVNLLVNGEWGLQSFDDYSVGLFNMESHGGTHIDAEDGVLSKNPIEHGSVDSVIGFTLPLDSEAHTEVNYWIAAGRTVAEVHELDAYVKKKGARYIIKTAQHHWRKWLRDSDRHELRTLDRELRFLYEESLLIMRAHTDKHGAIIASSDSDILNYGRDTYAYVWPRDAALTAHAFDAAGYHDIARRTLTFLGSLREPQGYMMHKYRSDGALGSSWHPWMWRGTPTFPIQEDETASVVFALWKHFQATHDLAFIESIYEQIIAPMADFMLGHIDPVSKLPLPSYDLWEEHYGTTTYTSANVFGALMAASEFAKLVGKKAKERAYRAAAVAIREGIAEHLFDKATGTFRKFIRTNKEEGLHIDSTIDISALHGLLFFEVFSVDDPNIRSMFEAVERELRVNTGIGGYVRYAGDQYYRISSHDPSNPWAVCTMWVAQYHIQKARTLEDLKPAEEWLFWARERALQTCALSEQVHPYTGEPLSATPLVWSHAEYVLTVQAYLSAQERLKGT